MALFNLYFIISAMSQTLPGEVYRVPAEPNQIETAVAERFGDAPWSAAEPPRINATTARLAGLEYDFYRGTYLFTGHPAHHWVTLLYGSRIVNADSMEVGARAELETVPLKSLPAIHLHLANTVLAGEQARPSTLVDPPVRGYAAVAGLSPRNNIFWLTTIVEGNVWPVMFTGYEHTEQDQYLSHDHQDPHTIVCLTSPQETQMLITQVGDYDLPFARQFLAGKGPRELRLQGDNGDPFGVGMMSPRTYRNGIALIDGVTDQEGYVHLLHYLMNGEGVTPEDRLALVEAHIKASKNRYNNTAIGRAAEGFSRMTQYTGAMVNFISRHATGRNTTQEAVDIEIAKFENGVVRVVKKILGEYDWAAEGGRPISFPRNTIAAGSLAMRQP